MSRTRVRAWEEAQLVRRAVRTEERMAVEAGWERRTFERVAEEEFLREKDALGKPLPTVNKKKRATTLWTMTTPSRLDEMNARIEAALIGKMHSGEDPLRDMSNEYPQPLPQDASYC